MLGRRHASIVAGRRLTQHRHRMTAECPGGNNKHGPEEHKHAGGNTSMIDKIVQSMADADGGIKDGSPYWLAALALSDSRND